MSENSAWMRRGNWEKPSRIEPPGVGYVELLEAGFHLCKADVVAQAFLGVEMDLNLAV